MIQVDRTNREDNDISTGVNLIRHINGFIKGGTKFLPIAKRSKVTVEM